jgi:hypothetical protein
MDSMVQYASWGRMPTLWTSTDFQKVGCDEDDGRNCFSCGIIQLTHARAETKRMVLIHVRQSRQLGWVRRR